jgi:6-pyruvoyltetrahydropterin/6-carboxytetrahydropterin synthase
MDITIRVEWDMGHRLPNHGGGCRNLHGHRYAAEVTLRGGVVETAGAPDEGMLVDFGPVKDMVRELLRSRDHRFLLAASDPLAETMRALPGVVVVPFIPTAERIAADLLFQVRECVFNSIGSEKVAFKCVSVARLRLYETPTSWADAS